jgi:hypothetical protein
MVSRKASYTEYDMSVSPTTDLVVDVPNGMTCCTITFNNVGSGGTAPRYSVTPSSGGTPLGYLWRGHQIGDNIDTTTDFTTATYDGPRISQGENGSMFVQLNVWNLNTAAPIVVSAKPMSTNTVPNRMQWFSSVVKSVSPVSQFIINNHEGATINTGDIGIQFYNRPTTVYSHDFSASPSTEWIITDLKKSTDSLLICAAYDLGVSSAAVIKAQVSDDGGITYFDATTDQNGTWHLAAGEDTTASDHAVISHAASTAQGMASEIWGLPLNTRTQTWSPGMSAGTGRAWFTTRREAGAVENTLRLFADAGTINAGTGYVIGYRL